MNNFFKGVAAGMTIGITATIMLMPKPSKKRAIKSSAGKAIKAVGSLVENFQGLLD